MKSWKTTVSGIAVLIMAGYLFYLGKTVEGGIALPIGLGLIAAKDGDVTGGTRPMTPVN